MKRLSIAECPNPYFARPTTFSLNGLWHFAITKDEKFPAEYTKDILVPFAPETPKSGIQQSIEDDDVLHYELVITNAPEEVGGKAAIIHFSAVDQIADVYWNDQHVAHHEGGYIPFSVQIDHLTNGDRIHVVVRDDTDSDVYPRGKQVRKPGTIWYTATSGIWGDVYVEYVEPASLIESIRLIPNLGSKSLKVEYDGKETAAVEIYFQGSLVAKESLKPDTENLIDLSENFHVWSPDSPNLYEVIAKTKGDEIHSVFGFRTVSVFAHNGKKFVGLNGGPIFVNALLDQGYYSPETGMTPPDASTMENELLLVKRFGFNALRKHIKIESLRWYYLCDKLGILVIQDMVNAGEQVSSFRLVVAPFIKLRVNDENHKKMGRANPQSREFFEKFISQTTNLLQPSCSLIAWTLFNEGWGQYDAVRLTGVLRELDSTRLIDSTSGWFDKGVGDFDSHHVYFRRPRLHNDGKRILSLSEYGGFSWPIAEHKTTKKNFGYAIYHDQESLFKAFRKCFLEHVLPLVEHEGLSVAVLTQWSDVEAETNGLITYDRAVTKIPPEQFKPLNDALYEAFDAQFKGKE